MKLAQADFSRVKQTKDEDPWPKHRPLNWEWHGNDSERAGRRRSWLIQQMTVGFWSSGSFPYLVLVYFPVPSCLDQLSNGIDCSSPNCLYKISNDYFRMQYLCLENCLPCVASINFSTDELRRKFIWLCSQLRDLRTVTSLAYNKLVARRKWESLLYE